MLGTQATTAGLTNLTSNFNLFFFSGPNAAGFRTASLDATGTDFVTLASWQGATGKDTASFLGDPLFVAPANNLHIMCGSPGDDAGMPVAGITTDFDGQMRDAMTPDIGADEQVAPTAVSIVSRKVHGGAGTFDISLLGSDTEPRSGGAMGDYEIVFTFGSPVTFASAAVVSGTGSVVTASGNNTNTITVDLTGVTDAQCIAVNLVCASDGVNTGDVIAQMTVLIGDTSNNNAVNGSDVGQTKSRVGQAVNATNFRSDLNASGGINAGDVSIVKTNVGHGGVTCKPLGKCYSNFTCTSNNVTTDCVDCLVTMMAGSWKDAAGVCHTTCPP